MGDVLVWLIIAALVGVVGELVARRRTPFGIVGAIIVGIDSNKIEKRIPHLAFLGDGRGPGAHLR
jgi:uncharacterized membrane protein YeaQ/YmgE (transglycosylase-associated protein family)